jgi:hypothetical protein
MEGISLTELLQLERNLTEAQALTTSHSQTSLLPSHDELLAIHNSSSLSEVSIDAIKGLLQQDGSFNLALSCSKCHQSLFYDDECASSGTLKDNLQSCCHSSFEQTKHATELEISFWWFLLNSFSSCVVTLPNYTRLMIMNGIPPSLRSRLWGLLTQASDSSGVVDPYMEKLYESLNTDVSPDISIISKDVNRTFPELSMFSEYKTKVKFERILNAYSIFDSDMGYCQGLQFIVAPLLFHFQDELKTFNALVKLFEHNKLRSIYDSEMSGLNLWFYQFEKIFEKELPALFQHFQELEIDLNIFLSQWFLSFYSVTMPFNFLIRMFDILLLEGVKETLFRVGIAILSKNADLLQSIDETELTYQHLLSENCWGSFSQDVDQFMTAITALDVQSFTQVSLVALENQFTKLDKKHTSNRSFFNKVLDNFKTTAESVLSSNNDDGTSKSVFSATNSSQFSINEDFDLVEGLYKLCLEKGIDDPLLSRVKEKLYA